jgi:MarR family transcriptional regulator, organic hydroperoxide resistance regulator
METKMSTEVDERQRIVREVMRLLPELGKAITRSMPVRVRHEGVSLAQVKALVHLFEYGPQTMGDLAEGLKITTPSATGLVNPLAEMGFVVRDRDQEDRRVVRVSLSERAEELAHSILDQRLAEVTAAMDGMSLEAEQCFLEGLERLAAAYSHGGGMNA